MFDVVVVGGGPAGLSAALMLGRCRRRVLLCDLGAPRNRRTTALHGYLTRDGVAPSEFTSLGRSELLAYGIDVRSVGRDRRAVERRPLPRNAQRRSTGTVGVPPDRDGRHRRSARHPRASTTATDDRSSTVRTATAGSGAIGRWRRSATGAARRGWRCLSRRGRPTSSCARRADASRAGCANGSRATAFRSAPNRLPASSTRMGAFARSGSRRAILCRAT